MLNGFINVLKPAGVTSSDVVVRVRKLLTLQTGEKQTVGHFGTLDPAGAGVLPIAVGRAARLCDYTKPEVKIYRAGFVFGRTTDTLDACGKVTKTCDNIPDLPQILSVLPGMTGEIDQVPPDYSAVSVGGQRAYDLARKGEKVELKARKVRINSIVFNSMQDNSFVFDINCNGGTYVRSIVRDIAQKLDTVGYMSFIIRLKSGRFNIGEAVTLEELEADAAARLLPVDMFFKYYPKITVPVELEDKVENGVKVEMDGLPDEYFAVYTRGRLLGVGEKADGKLSVRTRLI